MKLFVGLCLSIGLGTTLLAWGYYAGGHQSAGLALALFGIIWLAAQYKWHWVASVGFFAFTLFAGLGIIIGLPVVLMFASAVFALLAWDLGEFHHRRKLAAKEDETHTLTLAHLTRLGIALTVGIIAALLALTNNINFSFEWGALLLLAGALGIAMLVGRLRRNG